MKKKEEHKFEKDFHHSFKAAEQFEHEFSKDLKSIARELDTSENSHNALAKKGFHGNAAAIAAYNKRAGSVGAGSIATAHTKNKSAASAATFSLFIFLPALAAWL